jgi:WD40 repeat protein
VGGDLSWNSENELAIAYYGLMVYDASSGQALPTSNERVAQNKYFSRIAWGPDGNLIAGANLATVDIVDSSTGTILVNLASEFDSIEALAWNPDGNSLVIIDQGGLISSYDVSLYIGSLFPHALAGNDRTIVDNDHTSSETLVLDGSSSFDFDGTIVSYSWTENDVEIATGATPTVELAVGVHTIRLTITDDDGLTASEEIVITVESPILSVSEG